MANCWKAASSREADLHIKVAEKLKGYNDEIISLQDKVADLDKKKKDREGKLKNVEEPIKKLLDDKLTMQKKLDQKVLDKCSTFLTKHSDNRIVFIMQSLIGILRGQSTSDAYSVELYLKKLEGLTLALNRIDFKI